MRHTIIHIGANKTASTTLQRALFAKDGDICYIGEDASGYVDYADIINSMVSDDDLHFNSEECRLLFESYLKKEVNKTLVFSNEDVMTSRIPAICAKRLHSYMPHSKILLVVRNQYSAVQSFYANHGAFLKPAPPSYFRRHVSFDEWVTHHATFFKYGPLASFKYSTILSVYEDLFGPENVHVLMFEEFVRDKRSFVGKLADILRIDSEHAMQLIQMSHERPRNTNRMLAYNKFRSSFFWGVDFTSYLPFGSRLLELFDAFLSRGEPAKISMSENAKNRIFALYGKENSDLALKYNLPLAECGYPMQNTNMDASGKGGQ